MSDTEREDFLFHHWMGDDSVHDVKTKQLVRWEMNAGSELLRGYYWAKGITPWQAFQQQREDKT